jgi:hypothetical protein
MEDKQLGLRILEQEKRISLVVPRPSMSVRNIKQEGLAVHTPLTLIAIMQIMMITAPRSFKDPPITSVNP